MSISTSVTIQRKAKDGDKGDDGVVYWITPSMDSLLRGSDGKVANATLSAVLWKQVGSGLPTSLGVGSSSDFAIKYALITDGSVGSDIGSMPSSGVNLATRLNALSNNQVSIQLFCRYKNGSDKFFAITIPVISNGKDSTSTTAGPAGPTIRPCGEWKANMVLVNNSQYIDVVFIVNSDNEPVFYKLKDSYSSNSSFLSSSPASDTTHYETAQNMGFVATSVLLGKSGYIKVIGAAEILVSKTGTGGWKLTNGSIRHTSTGVELTEDGYINDPTGLHLKVGGIASNAILQPHANLIVDPTFQFGIPYTKIGGVAIANSTMTGYIEVLGNIGDSYNYFSPWQADGGQIMRMGIATNSYGADVNVYGATNAPVGDYRVKLIAGKTYTFSVWVKLSGDVMTNIASNSLLAEVNFWADESTTSDRSTQKHIPISNKCGSVGGFTQYYVTFTVPTGYEYFTWIPLVTIAKNKANFYISYAACKLEMSDVPTELDYNPTNAIAKKLLQTGIDIEENEILMTADNFKIQNNSGKETFFIDEYGNACLAGYLSENTNVIRSLDDFLSTFIPCSTIVDIDSTPGSEYVTYYDAGSSVSVKGAKVYASEAGWGCSSKTLNSSVAHGYTVPTQNTIGAMLDMRCASGIISLDWAPNDGSNVLPTLIVLPYMGVASTDSCYGVHMNTSKVFKGKVQNDLAVALKPNYNYSGSNVFTDVEAVATFNGISSNTNIHHGSEAGITKVNGVVCNTVIPPTYSLYFNLRGNVMSGSSSIDTSSFRFGANAMVYTNSKGANRFIKSATVYYYWVKNDGSKTTAKSYSQLVSAKSNLVNDSYKSLAVNPTYKDLYVFIRVVVGPNKDNSNNSETYDTNHTLFCSYGTYALDFIRTATKMNKLGLHYINYQELMSLVGHRFVLVNNTGANVFVINRADLGSGQFNSYDANPNDQTSPMIMVPIDTSIGFTMVCEEYMFSQTVSGFDIRYPIFYWKADEHYNGMLKNSDLTTDVWGGDFYF